MTRLHDQLVVAAEAEQLLDVAYRMVDSPSARCSWRRRLATTSAALEAKAALLSLESGTPIDRDTLSG
jgi:hypothetical protein